MAYRFMRFPGGKPKAVTFSYDDGCKEDKKLVEILNSFNMKCTFNLNSSRLIRGNDLTVDDAKSFIADGHEIAVHGENHCANGISSTSVGIKDVLLCREYLEKSFGCIIRGMAYPDTGITAFTNGTDYEAVRNYLSYLGIVYSRTLGKDNVSFSLPEDWYAWMPTSHHKNPDIFHLIDKFNEYDADNRYCADRHSKLFYIWGHTFEFTADNNWDGLYGICEKLGNREDIWYATNIEIYDYVNAYNSLIWSCDEKRVYNPTLYKIYFVIGDKEYSVASGETIVIENEA